MNILHMGSDHRAVQCSIKLQRPIIQSVRNSKKPCWKKIFNDRDFRERYQEQTRMTMEEHMPDNIDEIMQQIFADANDLACHDNTNDSRMHKPWHNAEIRSMIREYRQGFNRQGMSDLSKELNKKIRQELRKWRSMMAESILAKFKMQLQFAKKNDHPSLFGPMRQEAFTNFD